MSKTEKLSIDRKAGFIGSLVSGTRCGIDSAILQWACRHGVGNMTYFRYHDVLPAEYTSKLRNSYMAWTVTDIKFDLAYKEIKSVLNAEKIDFIPLKGMALILQNVYDSGAKRPHGDIDILFRSRSECYRAMEALKKHGWSVPVDKEWTQHIPPMVKNHLHIELHRYLPGMEEEALTDMVWQKYAEHFAECEYRLPLEMHFVIALTHCTIHHIWQGGAKFLVDAGMLSRMPGFDREKCKKICCEIGVGKVENLFAAFPEVFGGESVNAPQLEVLREQFLEDGIELVALVVTEKDRFTWRWVRRYMERLSVSWLRWKYNAADAPWWKIAKLMWYDYTGKLVKIFKFWSVKAEAEARRKNDALANEILGISVETANSRQFTATEE